MTIIEKRALALQNAIQELKAFIVVCDTVQTYRRASERTLDERVRLAMAYLKKCDPAVSGERGHATCYRVCCKVGPGFALPPEMAFELILEDYNPRCKPPWTEADLRHKLRDAYRLETRRGYMVRETARPQP